MSEKEGGDSKFMLGFVTGFLVGVLIALGVGASFVMVRGRHEAMRAHAAMEEAMMAREMAEMERMRAEAAAKEAAEMEKKAKEAAEKVRKELEPKQEDDADKVKVARVAIATLEKAIDVYRLTNGDYPESLEVLTVPAEGKVALLEAKALLDPWNRKYVYDPASRHPRTERPLLYSQGAQPGKSLPIRNWEADGKDAQKKDK